MPDSGEPLYDVFLSYSHKDRDVFGMEYIERIKEEIEKSLETIITDHKPRVFLDADALQQGDLWHSRILECLHQCKVIVCLVSEEYLNSEYCTRERLWWNAKQTHAGRFLDGPYPVYFVKLEKGIFSERREVKEMMAVQTDPLPWFEVRKQLQEEFIRERLKPISAAVCGKIRAAERAKSSFCSVLPPLYENFVGRVTELRELHELCVNGKIPVIQAAGGVGKTELSVAYAYGFADQYPTGRFLFRMERVTSWDEAFSKALEMEGTDAQGRPRKVSQELKLDDSILQKKDPAELHQAAAEALLERAATGKLLILLDNLDEDTTLLKKMRDFLCGSPIPENIHIVATTRGTFRFSERERFESYELGNLKEDEAFEMLCLTGNGQYPFDKNPPSAENPEYRAAREVIRFLDCHAWSMEIVSAFMADNYDPEGFNFAMELDALRKNLILSSESGVTYRAGENSATSAELLRPTLEKLATLELGAETLELAVFAACFDPDEIPLYLLREYWDRNFPNVTCSKGISFIYAVNQLVKYHLFRKDKENTCKMHRLVQAVFLSRKEKYLPHIIETLPKCPFIPGNYWVPLLLQNPEMIDICPQDGTLRASDWMRLLINPIFAEKCPWQSFSGRDWAAVLSEQPQFEDYCDWSKLAGLDWSRLLSEQPQFADKCDWSKLVGYEWVILLSKQSQFIDKCNRSSLGGYEWVDLLSERPQFANYCDWDKMAGGDWAHLLSAQPQFADKCDWDKMAGGDWACLLSAQPQFADKCDWDKLIGKNWASLLSSQPQFADICDWSKLDDCGELYKTNWKTLLAEQPQFADKCDWNKLPGLAWAWLLAEQPQFADKCDWSKLSVERLKSFFDTNYDTREQFRKDFLERLERQGLIAKFNVDSLDEWLKTLFPEPDPDPYYDWECGRAWPDLLIKQPQFADKCDWNSLDGLAWVVLLNKHPEWYTKINFMQLSPDNLAKLLGDLPQFAKLCNFGKLDVDAWSWLLEKQPQFAEYCDLSKLSEKDRQLLLEKFPELFEK